MKRPFITALAASAILLYCGNYCLANGFKILGVKSAKATAMGEAFTAQADDPTAVAFNPAGLTQVKGTQVSTGGTLTNGWVKHTSPTGATQNNESIWQIVPNSYITSDLGFKNVTFGLGVTAPNGLSSEWSDTGFARYVDTYSKLILIDINPSAAYRVNDALSLGAGISYYYSKATLESMIDYGRLIGQPGTLDRKTELNADGSTWGYDMGVLYKLTWRHSFAVTFKSPLKINYAGDAKYHEIPPFMGLGNDLVSDIQTSIKYPAVVVFGYAFRPIDRLKIEFNLDWTNWESVDSATVEFVDPRLQDFTYKYELRDTFAYKFGMEYSLADHLKLRAGYIFNENATPEKNWRPSLPDTNTQFLTAGLGYTIGRLTIDGAFQAIFYQNRMINNNVDNNEAVSFSSIDGKYENFALGFSVGVTYKF